MSTNEGADDQLRWGLGVILGTCFGLLPILTGRSDAQTTLIASAIGALVVLPAWRHVGENVTTRAGALPFVGLVAGMALTGWLFDRAAIVTFIGGWAVTLAALRLATAWRDV
jgi:hypothetical protein